MQKDEMKVYSKSRIQGALRCVRSERGFHLMLCSKVWNMRGITAENEHIQRALYLLSLPRGLLLHCFRAIGRERVKHKLSGWLIEGSFSLLADLDSLRPNCPVNFLFYRPRQRCLWASEEKMNAQKAALCDKMEEFIVLAGRVIHFFHLWKGNTSIAALILS